LVPEVPDVPTCTVFLQLGNGKEKLLLHIPWMHLGESEV